MPSYYSERPYVTGIALRTALEAIGRGRREWREARGCHPPRGSLGVAAGPIRFDDFGNPIQNIYVRKVERVGGKLQNTVIHTFPAVSQFWTYKAEDFLKNPVDSRDYPPCKHC